MNVIHIGIQQQSQAFIDPPLTHSGLTKVHHHNLPTSRAVSYRGLVRGWKIPSGLMIPPHKPTAKLDRLWHRRVEEDLLIGLVVWMYVPKMPADAVRLREWR